MTRHGPPAPGMAARLAAGAPGVLSLPAALGGMTLPAGATGAAGAAGRSGGFTVLSAEGRG